MDKTPVVLKVPSIASSFDVLIPSDLSVGEIIPLLCESLRELSNDKYETSGEELLCCLENNSVLSKNKTLAEYGIRCGDHLILI